MNSVEVNNLYEIVRADENINAQNLITKSFVLDLFGADTKCFVNDLDALAFLLEVRECYRSRVYAKSISNT